MFVFLNYDEMGAPRDVSNAHYVTVCSIVCYQREQTVMQLHNILQCLPTYAMHVMMFQLITLL